MQRVSYALSKSIISVISYLLRFSLFYSLLIPLITEESLITLLLLMIMFVIITL
jgi:hypothetical protein